MRSRGDLLLRVLQCYNDCYDDNECYNDCYNAKGCDDWKCSGAREKPILLIDPHPRARNCRSFSFHSHLTFSPFFILFSIQSSPFFLLSFTSTENKDATLTINDDVWACGILHGSLLICCVQPPQSTHSSSLSAVMMFLFCWFIIASRGLKKKIIFNLYIQIHKYNLLFIGLILMKKNDEPAEVQEGGERAAGGGGGGVVAEADKYNWIRFEKYSLS